MTMGERIKRRRQELRMSQAELADTTGLRRATISELESGKQPGMSIDTARKIARALGVSIDYIADTWGQDTDSEIEPAAVALVGA